MPHTSHLTCEGQTARLAAIIVADTRFAPHAAAHTKYMLRFQARFGESSIAIEKRKGVPIVYIDEVNARGLASQFATASIKPIGLTGRNSNLSAIFGDTALFAVKPADDAEFQCLLDCIV